MVQDVLADTFRCPDCGFFCSALPVNINHVARIDEDGREIALKSLRMVNYKQILDECGDVLPAGADLLDVGCAHGWFLDAARQRGLRAVGVEPDHEMAARARAAGHDVMEGFFPAILPAGAKYDAITFNDVLEHIPDVAGIVGMLPKFLNEAGVVIVNIPVSDGMIFKLSRQAARLGLAGPLARMWQQGLPSPHLSYFSASTLPRLFKEAGFEVARSGSLQSLSTQGLYRRIRYDRAIGPAKAAALYTAARLVNLVVGLRASDSQYFVFRRMP